MHCRRAQRFIFLFADGQAAGTLQVAFRTHLEICPRCAEELAAAERLLSVLRRSCRRDTAPDHLRSRLIGLLAERLALDPEGSDEC